MWYIWLLIGLWAGTTAGLFLACLLHCSEEADQKGTLPMRWTEWNVRNLEIQEHQEKYYRQEVSL